MSERHEVIEWDDIERGARRLVDVWTHDGDVRWMRTSWELLKSAGLTGFDGSGLGRTRVLARVIALAHIYWDFARVAADETTEIVGQIDEAMEPLGLEPLFLGQLVGENVLAESADGEPLPAVAALDAALTARDEVLMALRSGAGGESALFVSLWRSMLDPADAEDADGRSSPFDDLEEAVSDPMLAAYAWLAAGCEVIHEWESGP